MAPLPILLPLVMAVVVFFTPSRTWRPRLLAATALAHFALTVSTLAVPAPAASGQWLRLDAPGRLLLGILSLLFLCCAIYSVGYLQYRVERANRTFKDEFYDCSTALPTVSDFAADLRRWERVYNTVRPHQALGYLTPAEFLANWYATHPEEGPSRTS